MIHDVAYVSVQPLRKRCKVFSFYCTPLRSRNFETIYPPDSPLPLVVVQPKSVHSDPSEVKKITGNLLHLALFEAMGKGYPAIHHLYQTVKNEL